MAGKRGNLEDFADATKRAFAKLTDEQRLEIMGEYCFFCGTSTAKSKCYCTNDE